RRQGLTVQSVQRLWWPHTERVPAHQLSALTRQWAALLRAGVSLVPAMQMLERSAGTPVLTELMRRVREDVEAGEALSQALARHPAHFSTLYVSMVRAGEAAGILDTLMERLAHTLEKNKALRARVRAALSYPAVVIAIALAVLMLILLHVVPVFEDVFRAFGAELPWSTQLVLGLSHALHAHALWWALGGLCLAAAVYRQWRQPRWQRALHRRLLALPLLGDMLRNAVVARWAHTLSALLAAGVPLPEALSSAGQACAHPLYSRVSEHLQRRVTQGGRLSEGMAHTGRFPDMLVQLCATGEDTGTLETLLARAAEIMEVELDARVNALSSLLEPLIIVVLGGAIGAILVAMYLPIFRLGQAF
ncbi:MAG: type II secretion system F family protein, partial [Betaproteobacteria bacterium]|nr:type II secretion system F family protein [Betaproteobacteria bacterium]